MMEPGATVSHYKLLAELGKGGMGVVWSAEDTVLHRTVAIKFLSSEVVGDSMTLARFEREARVLASLNHPHVSAIYGLEKDAGQTFLVLEHVDGETLQERLARKPPSVEEALKLASQIARGVAAAHDRGVLHRDLKPGNIKVTREGQVKVLDFGLAKALVPRNRDVDPTEMETTLQTARHIVLGTAPYMSPEQASGSPDVDRRTDVWAFGCVLYELLSGSRAFEGKTVSEAITAIHQKDPDWSRLPEETPVRVRELLRRCLEKNPDRRLCDVSDARLEIDDALEGREWVADESTGPATAMRRRPPWVVAASVTALLSLGIVAGMAIRNFLTTAGRDDSAGGVVRFSVSIPEENGRPYSHQVSPDGRHIAYAVFARTVEGERIPRQLYLHSIERNETVVVAGSDRLAGNAYAFSPDGRWVAFAVRVQEPAKRTFFYKVEIEDNSSPIRLAEHEEPLNDIGHGLVWLTDDRIVALLGWPRFGKPSTKLLNIAPDGATLPSVVPLDQAGVNAGVSDLSPLTGYRLLARSTRGCIGCPVDIDSTTGRTTVFEGLPQVADAAWSPTGHLLFSRPDHEGNVLNAISYDPKKLDLSGASFVLTERTNAWGNFQFSRGGHLTLRHAVRSPRRTDLFLFSADGTPEPFLVQDRLEIAYVKVSGDGKMFAAAVKKGYVELGHEIWVSEMDAPALRRVGAFAGLDCDFAQISYTGRYVAASCVDWFGDREDEGLYLWDTDGGKEGELILASNAGCMPNGGFTRDERWLLAKGCEPGRFLIAVQPGSDGVRDRVPVDLPKGFAELSPDGRWVLHTPTAGNRKVVLRFHEDGSVGEAARVPSDPSLCWWQKRSEGNGLVCRTEDDRYFQVDLIEGPVARFSNPRPYLANKPDETEFRSRWNDTASDGRYLAMILRAEEAKTKRRLPEIEVVLNWTEHLKRELAESESADR